jgi:hypothetical protein
MNMSRHREARSAVAIQSTKAQQALDCLVSLAVTEGA